MRSNVDNKRVFGNILRRDVIVASKKEDDFGRSLSWSEIKSKFKSIHLSLTSVKNIVAIPSNFRIDEFVLRSNVSSIIEDGIAVASCENVMTNYHHWKFGCSKFL